MCIAGPTMPRIHAINILRAIFKTKALTHAIDPYPSIQCFASFFLLFFDMC